VAQDRKEKALDQENAFQVGEKTPKTRQIVFEEVLNVEPPRPTAQGIFKEKPCKH
jgi:hypothetical protein